MLLTDWILITALVCAPVLLRTPRFVFPLKVDPGDPTRFKGLWLRRYRIVTVTGWANDVAKGRHSVVTGSVTSRMNTDGGVIGVSGQTQTEVVVTDSFFLRCSDGHIESISVTGFEAHIANGHCVSVVGYAKGNRSRYFLICDHTTNNGFWNTKALYPLWIPQVPIYIAAMIFTGIGFGVVVIYGIAGSVQAALFRKRGVAPLYASLNEKAASLPRPPTDSPSASAATAGSTGIAAELERLTALRESGALSDDEFSAAKASLLPVKPTA
jgi:hypothetical protein